VIQVAAASAATGAVSVRTCDLWFKVQTKATGIVLYRGTDYNEVVGRAIAAHRNGWSVEVKEDADWGKMPTAADMAQWQGVGSNPATAGATFTLPSGKVVQ
jgi:hypothetical protein